jgi:hypothetical protein
MGKSEMVARSPEDLAERIEIHPTFRQFQINSGRDVQKYDQDDT